MRSVRACCWLAAVWLPLSVAQAQGMTTSGQVRHARNLGELLASFEFTFNGILSEEELANLTFLDPERVRRTDPELYEKVSQNIRRWTEDWIGYAATKLETVPPERLANAQRKVERIDEVMKRHFAERGWPYRQLRAVFLPQRLLFDEGEQYGLGKTLGAYMPFYPDVLFSTVDPSQPLELILVHENLHYNATNGAYGPPLFEGLTDSAARRLVATYGLLGGAELRGKQTYPRERDMIDVLCRRLAEVSGKTEERALEMLLQAYLTNDDSALVEVFGAHAWGEIVELSWTPKWRKSDILKILDGSVDD
jgi:hypothetical protein